MKFANFEAIARVKGIDLYSKNILLLIFNVLFIALLVFALSGLTINREIEASSFSFVIAIDNSESMSAIDILPNRLQAAKETAINFVDSLAFESNMAILSFSGDSRIEQALTQNKQEIKYAIQTIEISDVKGTDIFEAISNSIGLLGREKNKAIILLSDGQINMGDVSETIDYAKYNNVLIHTIAIGSIEGGETSYGFSKLDEETLKSLAYNTGGKYFNANTKEELINSFSQLSGTTKKIGSIDLSSYFLMIAVVLFIIEQFLMSINKLIW